MKNAIVSPHIVQRTTRTTVFLLITLLAVGGILLMQRGLSALLEGNISGSWMPALVGLSLMTGSFGLTRFRNDLVDD